MSSVAAASDSPPTVTVSLAGTSLPKRLQDMLAPVLSARRRKAFMSACETGGSFALVQGDLQSLLEAADAASHAGPAVVGGGSTTYERRIPR